MRSGTRRVADAKPDAPSVTSKDDTIPMSQIGKMRFSCFGAWHTFFAHITVCQKFSLKLERQKNGSYRKRR